MVLYFGGLLRSCLNVGQSWCRCSPNEHIYTVTRMTELVPKDQEESEGAYMLVISQSPLDS